MQIMLNILLVIIMTINQNNTQQQVNPHLVAMYENIQEYHRLVAQAKAKSSRRLQLHPAQQQVKREAKRFNVLCMGRRWGKTKFECDLLLETAEQGQPAGYFAPTYRHLMDGWRDLLDMAGPLLKRKDEQEKRIELTTGGVVECWSLDGEGAGGRKDYKAGRSRKYKRVVIDEAGLVPELEGIFEYAISPTLIDLKGDVWMGGTPNGRGGFYRFWRLGQKGSPYYDSEWASWQMPTITNTTIPGLAEELAREKRRKPEDAYKQEYEAEFLADSGQVFRNIHNCVLPKHSFMNDSGFEVHGIWQERALPYHVYLLAWDLAKKNDFSVMGVIDCTTKQLVHFDRFNHVAYMMQIPRLIALAEKFQPVEVVVEENSNLALIELLQIVKYQKRGAAPKAPKSWFEYDDVTLEQILHAEAVMKRLEDATQTYQTHASTLPITRFNVTNASKEEAIQALVLAFERQEISIPDDAVIIEELENFGMERLPSGKFRYEAQGDGHDDTVMMLAEGWYRARRYMSIEALPMRERAIRSLPKELQPDNIKNNPDEMAQISAMYHVQSFERKHQNESQHFLRRFANLGR